MNQRTVARGLLAGAGLVTAVLLTACQGSSSAGGSPSSLDVTSTTAPATTTAAAAPTTTVGQPGGSGGTPECKAASLKLSIGSGDAAAGHFYVPIVFTNTGSTPCLMRGFPGVSYVTGDNGAQVGQPATRTGSIGSSVTLAPNAVASSVVTVTDISVFDASACKPTSVRGFRVYAPDDTASLFVARSGSGCAGNPPSPQLQVQTVKAGAGSA
ncbi:MAG TPA: DUF4232 domain-containing protein [Pseudonocardiaceae bacterium]|jgi:hypothetical protein|nr:DUF4232 domain-containing protein [Pseudonocardiaceae bacterium]